MVLLSELVERGLGRCSVQVLNDSRRIGARTVRLRAGAGPVALVAILTNDVDSIELILSAVESGVSLVSLPLPARGSDFGEYASFLRGVASEYMSPYVICSAHVGELLAQLGLECIRPVNARVDSAAAKGFELHQYTSGTTGSPRKIRLSDAVIGANVDAILERLGPLKGDATVSWLPLSHDMGLIGMLLSAVAAAGDNYAGSTGVHLMRPEDFMRNPTSWLSAISELGGAFTAVPNFALELLVRREARNFIGDLSSIRCLIVGSDVVRGETLDAFEGAFAERGLGPLALSPAYGMAELALCATMTPPDERWRRTGNFASSGPSLRGYSVALENAGSDGPAPVIVTTDWWGSASSDGDPIGGSDRARVTGDLGWLSNDWLTVVGRWDDVASVRGVNVSLIAVEEAVRASLRDRADVRRIAAIDRQGELSVLLEAERTLDETEKRLTRAAVVRACGVTPASIEVVGRGAIPVTTSGKIRRHMLRTEVD